MTFAIRHEQFEGPIELLLALIEKRKLFINDFALASVTEEYIEYANTLQSDALEKKTGFLVVAATLVLIKSRSLLPNLELTTEEQKEVTDLESRLKRYQAAQRAGLFVRERFGIQKIFSAERNDNSPVFAPDKKVTIPILFSSLKTLIATIPQKESPPEVRAQRMISIEEMINSLEERITTAMTHSFRALNGNRAPRTKEERVTVIVSFLAMLELIRKGICEVTQEKDFEDIIISRQIPEQTL